MKFVGEEIVQDDQENEWSNGVLKKPKPWWDEPTDSNEPPIKKKCTALSHLLSDIYPPNQQYASQNDTIMETELAFYKSNVCLDHCNGGTMEGKSYTVPFTFATCKKLYICSCYKCEVRKNIFDIYNILNILTQKRNRLLPDKCKQAYYFCMTIFNL